MSLLNESHQATCPRWLRFFAGFEYIDIDSKPTGATIYVDGEKTGLTRSTKLKLDFSDDPSRRVLIQLTKPRYRPVFQYWEFDEVPEEKKVFPLEAD